MHAVTAFPGSGRTLGAAACWAELAAPDGPPEELSDWEIPPVEPSDVELGDVEPGGVEPGDVEHSDLEPSDLERSSNDWPTDDESNWDVFLSDDDERDPLPEEGDFWIEGSEVRGREPEGFQQTTDN